jgi:hypothetical protein
MKRSELRKIIKEEYIKILSEAFGDPIAQKLQKMGGLDARYQKFWKAAASKYDIAWDKLPKGSFRKINSAAEAKKGMTFFVIASPKPNPYMKKDKYGYSFDETLPQGVLGVTIDGKPQYFHEVGGTRYNRGKASIGMKGTGFRGAGDAIGKGQRGIYMFKKLADVADLMYNFDLESFRGGTTALKSKRAELQSGADMYSDPKKFKTANIARYKAMLADRVGSRGQVDKMVADIVKITNDVVGEAMTLPRMNQYNELVATVANKEVKLTDVTRNMNYALEEYARFIQYENDDAKFVTKYPEYGEDTNRDSFYKKDMKRVALDIKGYLNNLKTGRIR